MLENSPKTRNFSPDRIFPIIALALVVVLIAGLAGVSGYLLLGRGKREAPTVRAMDLTDRVTPTVQALLPAAAPSPTPTLRPTNTPVVQPTPTVAPTATLELTPLPTPPLPTPTPGGAEAQGGTEQVPQTGLGVLESAGLAGVLMALVVGARALRRRAVL
ncbi:MAG: hypothetical protein H5T59_14795 [Anaerolineae bacterium]|nr:hypothetical protein [Anaerolineae bacterium]